MPGLRISHPDKTSVTYTLVDASRPYPTQIDCWRCDRVHLFKTYHIDLDDSGHAIVSREIWQRLQRIPDQPFTLANEVRKPPKQTIVLGRSTRVDALPPIHIHQETRR